MTETCNFKQLKKRTSSRSLSYKKIDKRQNDILWRIFEKKNCKKVKLNEVTGPEKVNFLNVFREINQNDVFPFL